MKIGRLFQTALGLLALGVMFVGVTDSVDANDQHSEKVKASFLEHINSLESVPAPQKAAIKKTVSETDSDFFGCAYRFADFDVPQIFGCDFGIGC